jgi:hypothetical protein
MPDASGPSLSVLGGPLKGKRLVLDQLDTDILIGSDPTCHFSLPLPGVSPVHARLRRRPGGYSVEDARSQHGVFVNDDKVPGEAPVRDGDVLWLGPPGEATSVMISCRLPPVAAPPPPALLPVEFILDEGEGTPTAPPADDFVAADEEPAFWSSPRGAGEASATPGSSEPDEVFFVTEEPAPDPGDVFFFSVQEAAPSEAPAVPVRADPQTPVPPAPPPAAKPPQASPPPVPPPEKLPPPPAPRPSAAPLPVQTPAERPRPPTPRRAETPPPKEPRRDAPPRQAPRSGGPSGLFAALAAISLLLVGGFFAFRHFSPPRIESVSPQRTHTGQTVTLLGSHFASSPQDNTVLFGERRANVVQASSSRLEVEVPQLPLLAGRDGQFSLTVLVGGRSSDPVPITVYQAPRIDGLSPDVAMPGEEIELAGAGWTQGATVRFGSLPAEITATAPNMIKVRVPAIEGATGTSVPVVVAMGADESNPAPFMLGHLPLVTRVEPEAATPGEVVTVTGRGLHSRLGPTQVRVGTSRAFALLTTDTELKVVVPWVAAGSPQTLEVRVPGLENPAQASLKVSPLQGDVVDFRFTVEPLDDNPDRAVLSTELGPAFVVFASGGRSAGDRALEAMGRLGVAAITLKASLDADFQVRGPDTSPVIGLVGKPDPVLEVSNEDAAGYGQLGRGNVTPARLARWWNAIARDLAVLLIRGQKPQYAFSLAPEGRVLGDVYQAARKTGRFGVPRQVVTPFRDAMKAVAFRVPVALVETGSGLGGSATLQLTGTWRGTETVGGERNYVTVTFKGGGGTAAYGGTSALSMNLLSLEQPQKNSIRYSVQLHGIRYYVGSWDGHKISGKVYAASGDKDEVGSFELVPGQ